jgi:NAD(P)-dependent dehydrogenase (short-subunit alcohol dehydrogenase family)
LTEEIKLFSLQGKTALVTGGLGHLGSVITRQLALAGATVYVNSRSSEKVKSAVTQLRASGLDVYGASFDVRDDRAVQNFVKTLKVKQLNILVNNAYAGPLGDIKHSDTADYLDSYNTSVVATHRLVRSLLPKLRFAVRKSGDASVINIASMYGIVSADQRIYGSNTSINPPFYGAAKAALIQWSRYAACEFAHEGIRVNSISPGSFPADSVCEANPEFVDRLVDRVPMRRIGKAEEISGPVIFLASAASSYVTGANIVVDGGWTIW